MEGVCVDPLITDCSCRKHRKDQFFFEKTCIMTVTGPLRDRYGTVTGVPLISVNVAIFPLKSATKAISVKFPLKSTVTGPLRDHWGHRCTVCDHHLDLISLAVGW